jgi:hypothetical protein
MYLWRVWTGKEVERGKNNIKINLELTNKKIEVPDSTWK